MSVDRQACGSDFAGTPASSASLAARAGVSAPASVQDWQPPVGLSSAHVAALRAMVAQGTAQARGAAVPSGSAAILDAVGQATLALLGPGLLTVNAWRPELSQVVRLWSSEPAAYPVGGSKHKGETPWAKQVLHRGEVFVGEGDAALAEVFDDIARIRALGLRAVVNVPIRERGRCIATFNYLSPRPTWRDEDVDGLCRLAAVAALAFAAAPA